MEPDIVCAAKGIASGMPIGAMIARESIMDCLQANSISTFGGNPLAMAGALANIEYLLEHDLQTNASKVGRHLKSAIEDLGERVDIVGEVRGKGLMIGVEFVTDRKSKKPAKKLRERILDKAFAHGLLMLGCGESTIRLSPPLSISQKLMDEALVLFESAITESEAEGLH